MDKETIELVNYIRTLIPPGVSQKQAITSFAVLLADAVYQIDKEKCTVYTAAIGYLETCYKMMQEKEIFFK